MNVWTFLDRNWFWLILPAMIVVGMITDCGKRDTRASGCGVEIKVGSSPHDAGTE